jgi:pSer/pThr/pTyr-binding forkhead associated (FHA) protein
MVTFTLIEPRSEPLGQVRKQEMVIGKRPTCDVRLNGVSGISGRHAILRWRDGTLWASDQDSAEGVTVDGVQIPMHQQLSILSGARLGLGKTAVVAVDIEAGV